MTLINGQPGETIPVQDRGLLYGDGVFRTMLREEGHIRAWPRHYRKLAEDCAALSLPCPEVARLEADIARLPPSCVVKIIVTRGVGQRGYVVPAQLRPTLIVSASALPSFPEAWRQEGVQVRLCGLRLAPMPRLAGVKHLNRLENVLARMEWDDPEIAEGLLCDESGALIEGVSSNVFLWRAGVLETPDLSRCGVSGVQRARLLEGAERLGIPVAVRRLELADCLKAEALLLTNSVIGLWQVRQLDGHVWPASPVVLRLRALLEQDEAPFDSHVTANRHDR